MEVRDVIVSWLEQGENFSRVTAAAPFSPSTREDQELANFVNHALPHANWDARHAKQMLKHYLLNFRCTASADVSLGEKQRRCRHFSRLQTMYKRKDRGVATERSEEQENRPSNAQPTDRDAMKGAEGGEEKTVEETPTDKTTQGFSGLASDVEEVDEELPVGRRSTRAKKRATGNVMKSAHKNATSDKPEQVEVVVSPTQTTQAGSDAARDSPRNDEDAPSLRTGSLKTSSGNRRRSVSQPAQPKSKTPRSTPRHKAKNAAMVRSTTSKQVPSRKPTQSTVPESLRSAIAEVVSQRQQLLDSRRNDPKSQDSISLQRQRSLSDSDYGLSDIDLPSVDPKPSASSNGKRRSKPSYDPHSRRYEPGPPEGLLPPLIDWSHTNLSKSNLKRKRVFLTAKQLAFEQLQWYREKELQQRELELLHREMKTREVLAEQELELRRMRIRADIIQPMISAGASIADITERLKLL